MGVKPIKDKQALTADGEKALPTAAANKVKNLSVGSTGADVVKLQKALGIDADGIFGPQTQQAVINYQKANGLDPDGIAGELTLGKLYGTTANNTVPPVASNPPTAKPPAANPPAAQLEPEAPSKTVTSPAGFTYGDFHYDPFDPQADPLIQQANALLQQHQANRPGEYKPVWQDEADAYLSQYQNRDPFSYDFNSDALYNQYKDQYIQQGRMAMMDTMGQAAALTGGYGNSYAQTVGQQAYNQQLNQLNEVMPELYQMALNRYTQEGQNLLDMYGIYMDKENQEYGRYQDGLNNWYTQLGVLTDSYNTEYNRGWENYLHGYNTAYDEYQTDRGEAFSKWQTEQNQKFTTEQNQLDRDTAAQAEAKEYLIGLITGIGYEPTDSELAAAGISKEQAEAYKKAYSEGGNTSNIGLDNVKAMSSQEIVGYLEGYQKRGNNTGLEAFLDDCVLSGRLTKEQADNYYAIYRTGTVPEPGDTDVDPIEEEQASGKAVYKPNRGGGAGRYTIAELDKNLR